MMKRKGNVILICAIVLFLSACNTNKTTAPVAPPKPKVVLPKNHLDSAYLNRDIKPFQIKEADAKQKQAFLDLPETKAKLYRLDTLFQSIGKVGDFNGTILIAQKGVILYQAAFGYARKDIQASSMETIYQLASVSKPLTAMAVLQLVADHRIDLDSTLSYYIPRFPYQDVTIRQLLSHRSGLPNYIYFTDESYINRLEWDYMTNQELLDYMRECPPPISYPPDHRFIYCNTNYALLATLIEEVSDMAFSDYMQKYLFQPLGMTHTFLKTPYHAAHHTQTALGYYINGRSVENNYQDGVFGDKGCYSTATDLYRFHMALCQGFIDKNILEASYTNTVTEEHRLKKYGLGWRLRYDDDSTRIVYHNGWWHGFRAAFHRRPEDESCVILLSNKLNRRIYDLAVDAYYILDGKIRLNKIEDEDAESSDSTDASDSTDIKVNVE